MGFVNRLMDAVWDERAVCREAHAVFTGEARADMRRGCLGGDGRQKTTWSGSRGKVAWHDDLAGESGYCVNENEDLVGLSE